MGNGERGERKLNVARELLLLAKTVEGLRLSSIERGNPSPFGEEAEVLAPAGLRTKVAARCSSTSSRRDTNEAPR